MLYPCTLHTLNLYVQKKIDAETEFSVKIIDLILFDFRIFIHRFSFFLLFKTHKITDIHCISVLKRIDCILVIV